MSKSLSILLPTFNCFCRDLVTELQYQCEQAEIDYEIIVADDGSTDKKIIEKNKPIINLKGVTYILRKQNVGRSAIRNFLISISSKSYLLFIDGDLSINNPHFIENYIKAEGDVIVGGLTITNDVKQWGSNLRFRYEQAFEKNNTLAIRQNKPYQNIRTTNLLIARSVIGASLFDENFSHYGYEDVLLGKIFERKRFKVTHIDNPILLNDFETNEQFLYKTEQALQTLNEFQQILKGYSKIIEYNDKFKVLHLHIVLRIVYKLIGKSFKKYLLNNKPRVFLFNLYKLLYFAYL